MSDNVYNKRYLNFAFCKYENSPILVNPYCMMKFDSRLINDLLTVRIGPDKKEVNIIAACNDPFLRIFSLKD
jgi:hypothetical protein